VANGKHKKTCIFQLKDSGQIIRGKNQLESYITDFYKGLFGASEGDNFSLDENRVHDIPQVSTEENEALTTVFSEKR
jgi:hypothetical protein